LIHVTKIKLLFLCLLMMPLGLFAQKVEITPFGGYMFPAKMNGSDGYVRFQGNAQYGGMLSIAASRVVDIDLIYTRTDTKAEVSYYLWPYEEVPVSINYIHGGFTKNCRASSSFPSRVQDSLSWSDREALVVAYPYMAPWSSLGSPAA